ncbi:G-alpha-domain-containing protein [Dendrothele bispora CBS 962.96]|uniref:G-alpha-domain-containing protein n=1 Tax=Dendrothele bispora (strain CBS 962.96) TaxID=1314807 RepID=A0A4S8M502_DENBC|nr:G-alpha-domain-containing protein [Dendrothele bispora CBS 962.96]
MDSFTRKKGKERAQDTESVDNPFIVRFKAPANETEEERIRRVRAFADAQKVSKQIDENLAESKKKIDRRKKAMKILLLGQAESGKSAVLKNFRMAFTPHQFQKERGVWKTIVQLNLIGSVKTILNALENNDSSEDLLSSITITPPQTPPTDDPVKRNHRKLHLRLSPLLSVETNVNKMLSVDAVASKDICVRAGSGWKSKLGFRDSTRSSFESMELPTHSQSANQEDLSRMLAASKDDIIQLWGDPEIQELLWSREIYLSSMPGFFLDEVARIAAPDYEPTDCDIVRARVRTVGVEEHHLIAETVANKGSEFYIADVGGSRGSRWTWVPYFDDVQAILFLAPLAFNQMLEEDPRVNRLEDTLMIWREICANVLLADCNIIVFFNKKDILQKTLESGVQVNRFVPSYGDQPNDVPSVTKYFKDRFKAYHKRLSPKPRAFISHETSAIDTHSTIALVIAVHDGIIRNNLQRSDML